MPETSQSRDAINIDESVHHIYKELRDGTDPVESPFTTMKDIFMWAVFCGAELGLPKEIKGKKTTIFHWSVFSEKDDIPLLKALAISKTKDVNLLLDQNQILTIAEEYANAGILHIRDKVLKEGGSPLWNLVSMISDNE